MTDLEHIDVLDKVETYVKYLKYAEVYDQTSDQFKKLFDSNVLAIILDGKSTFLEAYNAISKADLNKLDLNNQYKATQINSAGCHSSSLSKCGSSSSSCHSTSSSSSSSCHSSGSSSSSCSSTARSSCQSSSGC